MSEETQVQDAPTEEVQSTTHAEEQKEPDSSIIPEEKPATPKKKVAKKSVKDVPHKSKKKPKAVGKTSSAKKEKKGKKKRAERKPKEGLRVPQVNILKVLAKTSKPLSRKEIAEKGQINGSNFDLAIGKYDPEERAYWDQLYPCLVTLGYVKMEIHDVNGRDIALHTITASGKKALEKVLKEVKSK